MRKISVSQIKIEGAQDGFGEMEDATSLSSAVAPERRRAVAVPAAGQGEAGVRDHGRAGLWSRREDALGAGRSGDRAPCFLLSNRIKRLPRRRSRTRLKGPPWAVRQGEPKALSPARPPRSAECGSSLLRGGHEARDWGCVARPYR